MQASVAEVISEMEDFARGRLAYELEQAFPKVEAAWKQAWAETHRVPRWYLNTYAIRDFAVKDMMQDFMHSTAIKIVSGEAIMFRGTLRFNDALVQAEHEAKRVGMPAAAAAIRFHGANPVNEGVVGSFWAKQDGALPYLAAFLGAGPNTNAGGTKVQGAARNNIFTRLNNRGLQTTRDSARGETLMDAFAAKLGLKTPLGHAKNNATWNYQGGEKNPGVITEAVWAVVYDLKAHPLYGAYFQ